MSIVSPELNVFYNGAAANKQGFIKFEITLTGASLNQTFVADYITFDLQMLGSPPVGDTKFGAEYIGLSMGLLGEAIANRQRANWVGWGKIGEANFKMDLVNDAGFRPMVWDGYCFALLQLGNSAVAYGTNGVTLIYPAQQTFGFRELENGVGVKSKDSVAGNDKVHYFIDRDNQLWKVTEREGAQLLDYSEFLSTLNNPVCFYDNYQQRLIISDETNGFILTQAGLGGGYYNLTGYVRDAGTYVVASCTTVTRPQPYIITAPIDFGQRGSKTITSVHMSTDTPELFELAYDYRFTQGADWKETHWVPFNSWGTAFLRCSALEFRIKIKAIDDELDVPWDAQIDYLNINIQFTDQRFKRSAGVGRPDNREPAGAA
jgi:hypothetical protein